MNQAILLQDCPRDLAPVFAVGPMRDPATQTAETSAKPFPLAMATDGERVRIQSLQGGKGLMLRLTELGLNQGAELRVVQRQGGGLVVARGETRIALGGGMATKILVMAVAP
ncbi:FeoA family protein [Thiocystis violascens]|uniref:Fe2+ transport system protein A n=1 Tax=Thiocystis violascens (strain ATCC 17096 / DSM 198 / 6111) TaxID=765911 RepID=I3YA99_THIV6|nr:FeoA family protein [Thiocystis violascens]AFL73917.1 Fe2+ transport system protein A [Thiocystis violascens DSM 198]